MADAKFDAFLTYNRGDRRLVRRVQRFLESFRPPKQRRRLAVYLDQTDMRGGSLPDNLAQALVDARALVVCWSDKAAASSWVSHEIAEFRRLGRDKRIAIVHVGGAGPTVNHEALRGLEPIEHDLRDGWWGPFLKPRAKLELLRLLAFLTNVDMRVLRNWARRRLIRNALLMAATPLVPLALILSLPQPYWEPVPLTHASEPIEPVACEVVDGKLWAASWYEAAGETSGGRAFFQEYPDVLATPNEEKLRPRTFVLPKRALPLPIVGSATQTRVEMVLDANGNRRKIDQMGSGDVPRVAVPRADRLVFIQPIRRDRSLQDLEFQARDRLPIPETNGTVIVVHEDGGPTWLRTVADFSPPLWSERTADRRLTSPSRSMSVVWQDSGDIWIGAPGERDIAGGLWHSPDGGRSWTRIDGFFSVTSLDIRRTADGNDTLMVAEQSFKRLNDTAFVAGSSRLVERRSDGTWVPSDAPPYGTNSEIEICGTLADETLYVRVDNQIYRQGTRSVYASIVGEQNYSLLR